jgi:hypothetical protein
MAQELFATKRLLSVMHDFRERARSSSSINKFPNFIKLKLVYLL